MNVYLCVYRRKILRLVAPAFMALTATMAQSASSVVVELEPQALAGYIAKHPYVVVQATSPDNSCTYCVGADKVFDQTAAQKHALPWMFARVQWSPWHKIPDFGSTMKVYGVPVHYVFIKDQTPSDAGGRPASASAFSQKIAAIAADNADSKKTGSATAQGADRAQSGDPSLSRWLARDQFLDRTVVACSQMYPGAKSGLTQTYQQWKTSNKTALSAAATQLLTLASQQASASFDAAIRTEKAAVQKLLTQDLNIDWKQKPTESQCALVVNKVTQLPAP